MNLTEEILRSKYHIVIESYLRSCWVLVNRSNRKPSYRGKKTDWKNQPIIHDPFGNKQDALASVSRDLT